MTLARFSGPVVIANVARDKENIKQTALFLEHVPSAHVITIDDAGHACALQQPKAFADAIELVIGRSRPAA